MLVIVLIKTTIFKNKECLILKSMHTQGVRCAANPWSPVKKIESLKSMCEFVKIEEK